MTPYLLVLYNDLYNDQHSKYIQVYKVYATTCIIQVYNDTNTSKKGYTRFLIMAHAQMFCRRRRFPFFVHKIRKKKEKKTIIHTYFDDGQAQKCKQALCDALNSTKATRCVFSFHIKKYTRVSNQKKTRNRIEKNKKVVFS